jgi:myo-inositol catabolism protein IolS
MVSAHWEEEPNVGMADGHLSQGAHHPLPRSEEMNYRPFGRTDLQLSEVGFGAWAMGGRSFGTVPEAEAMDALARAEELGCNFIDSAAVYGNAEEILGRFLSTRRARWIVASKYSGQKEGMRQTLESQLSHLGTDYLDFYQIHWMPGPAEDHLFHELLALKEEGKVRYVGVSIYTSEEVRRTMAHPELDGFQLKMSLLTPSPFLELREEIARAGKGLLARSALEDGFLTGKYGEDARFTHHHDRRSAFGPRHLQRLARRSARFSRVGGEDLPLLLLATRYVLAFPEVSSLLLSTKNRAQAETNFGAVPREGLPQGKLQEIEALQEKLGLRESRSLPGRILRRLRNL